MKDAADHSRGECLWFEQGCKIGCECSQDPDEPCAASMVPTITSSAALGYPGLEKYFPDTPWRAPGYAQIHDSCGLSGGGRFFHPENGGSPAPGYPQGFPGSKINATKPAVWQAGKEAFVGWSIKANHAGGYIYRLAPLNSTLDEATFEAHVLEFSEPFTSYIQYGTDELNRTAIKATPTRKTKGNATWKKNPIPGCIYVPPSSSSRVHEQGKLHGGLGVGNRASDGSYECAGPLFKPPLPNLFGFGDSVCGSHVFDFECTEEQKEYTRKHFEFSILDKIIVPSSPGRYVLLALGL